MTEEQMRELAKGARVRVLRSGKVYQVTYPVGRQEDGSPHDQVPEFRQVAPLGGVKKLSLNDRTEDLDGQPARLYGPAFVRLKPENVEPLG